MVIAIDYDGTYSRDPSVFERVARLFREAGHQVIMVTQRLPEHHDTMDALIPNSYIWPLIFAGGDTKVVGAAQGGFPKVDIWIDDNPSSVNRMLTYIGPSE